ncbi:MAG: DUF488 family protein [Propionibacteriales bacterium]|nr:DUF488 family protein [Propionibacteriales bacterium]
MLVGLKRVYDPVEEGDGLRVLVDRLWPRGVRKDDPRVDEWLRDLAPSHELRREFHGKGAYADFVERYRAELDTGPAADAVEELRRLVAGGDVTLVYAAKDTEHNNATALRDILRL